MVQELNGRFNTFFFRQYQNSLAQSHEISGKTSVFCNKQIELSLKLKLLCKRKKNKQQKKALGPKGCSPEIEVHLGIVLQMAFIQSRHQPFSVSFLCLKSI